MRYVSAVLAMLTAFFYLISALGGFQGGIPALVALFLVMGVMMLIAAILVMRGYSPLLLVAAWAVVICTWAWTFYGLFSIVSRFPGENIQQLLVVPALTGLYDLAGLVTALIAWRTARREYNVMANS